MAVGGIGCAGGVALMGALMTLLHVPLQSSFAQPFGLQSPVGEAHLQEVNHLFRASGVSEGYVTRDRQGRVELQGTYRDEQEVDKAFSLAQTVVGVRWVSPVTPQRIKVKEWEKCLARLLSNEPCGSSPAPSPSVTQ